MLALSTVLPSQVVATRPAVFLWDYPTELLNAGNVNRFELQIDGGTWADVGRTAATDQTGVPAGAVLYAASVPALTIGSHVVAVRACNVTECGDISSLKFVISIKPGPVQNLRIGGGDAGSAAKGDQ